MAHIQDVLDEILAERRYQADRWNQGDLDGLVATDLKKIDIPDTWWMWMARYAGTWNDYSFPYQYNEESYKKFRTAMVKVAALAVAAILWVDAKLEGVNNG